MSRSTRMFEIIQLLRSANKPLTAQILAEELEVSPRTVYRDVASLQSMRVPIDGEAGVGYVMSKGYDLPPLMFTPEEFEAIAVGMAMLGRTGDRSLLCAAENVVRKISEVLPTDGKNSFSDRSVFTSKWHAIPTSGMDLQTLRQSIREEWKLRIKYKDESGKRSKRTILPLAVFYYVDVVVLATWCELRQDFRHFRVDRIVACKSTGESFADTGVALRKQWRVLHHIG